MVEIDRQEIAGLTETYGGVWGIHHTRRLLQLVAEIGVGQEYDADVVWMAAHLHDWGAYPNWEQPGVDHALRSTEVAGEFLRQRNYPEDWVTRVLECIEFHHNGDPGKSIEAILLSDADGLDFLGAVGVLRDFSKAPKDLRKAYETVQKRRAKVPQLLCLERSREIAAQRLRDMDEILAHFEADSFGFF